MKYAFIIIVALSGCAGESEIIDILTMAKHAKDDSRVCFFITRPIELAGRYCVEEDRE